MPQLLFFKSINSSVAAFKQYAAEERYVSLNISLTYAVF